MKNQSNRMNRKWILLGLLIGLSPLGGCATDPAPDCLVQVSTLHALLEGVYDGPTRIESLQRSGDLGLGTFNALDGELAMVDGIVYRIDARGEVSRPQATEQTPFACVTFFQADQTLHPPVGLNLAGLQTWIDQRLATLNLPYAIRIRGRFAAVKTRSVPAQTKPYPRLVEVAKKQPTFEFRDVQGVLVGFRLPDYFEGINLTGYHLHFLTADRTGGGHLLGLTTKKIVVELDLTPEGVTIN